MFKTIEDQVRQNIAPPQVRAEFREHDFERLHSFCLLIYCLSTGIWIVFDLLVSFIGGQGFTWLSMLFISLMGSLTVVLVFVRNARHFSVLNLIFIGVIALGVRLVIDGIPEDLRSGWLVLGASSILYSASVLPLRRWSFFGSLVLTWLILNPYSVPQTHLLDLRGAMILCYSAFITGLTVYSYLKLRQAKLQNFSMSKMLLEQAYNDALTEIPNRRSFMTKAQMHQRFAADEPGHYIAMVDVDNFKKVNDQFGHDSGDVVLKRIAANIKASMGEFEYARLGGEEFVIYLWGLDPSATRQRIQALCTRVREDHGEHPVTISIGLAHIEEGDTIGMALGKADQALYQAKRTGKDRFVLWAE